MKYTVFEIVSMLWQGFIARPELVIPAIIIFALLCIGAYCELQHEREECNERCRRIKERSKMR
jgi:hypothetical protein